MENTKTDDKSKDVSKEDIKRLISYALKFKSNFFKGVFMLVIAVGFVISSPFIIKDIFDNRLIQETPDKMIIFMLALLYLVLEICGSVSKYLGIIQLRIVSEKVVQSMRTQLYNTIQKQPISFFDNMPAGKIVSKITNDTAGVGNLYVTVFSQFLTSFVYLVGVLIALFVISPSFAMVCIFLMIIFLLIVKFYTKHATKHNYIIREKLSDINAIINETIQGMSIVQAFNGQEKILDEFDSINDERYKSSMKLMVLESALSHNIIGFLRGMSFVIMIFYFGIKVAGHSSVASIGIIYVYMNYLSIIFQQTNGVFDKMPQLQRSIVASKHVFELMDEKGIEISNEHIEKIEGSVKFENISFAYKEDEYVLKDISFEVDKGQVIGLVGHTGSGKSSILNLLMKFYSPQKGRILIDDKDIADMSTQGLREYMGIVLQEPYLFTGTILSNITLDNPAISREMAIKALEMVGGDVVTQNLKDGIDEKVVERGATLSAGQRQLISFARALAHNPRILILDEATSSIDSETEKIIQDAMAVLMKNRTTLVIAHRLSTIKNADKIILLDKGKIIEQGNHDELIEKKGKYYEMYKAQSKA